MGQTEDARVAAEVARRMQRGETRRAGPQGPFEPKPEAEVEAEVRAEFAERDQLAAAGRRGARRARRSTTTRDSVAGHGEESALAERYAAQEAEKKAAGGYTLQEAAKLAAGGDERVRPALLARFIEAARTHALPTYLPGTDFRLRYGHAAGETVVVREFYEHARGDELNAWLAANEPRVKFRFQCPTGDNADKRYATPLLEPNRPIALPAGTQRLLIADALARLRSARGEAAVDFYENAGGEVVVRLEGGHVPPPNELKSDFVAYLGAAGVRPTSPAGRWSATYSGTLQDDNLFEITVAEFERFAQAYDIKVFVAAPVTPPNTAPLATGSAAPAIPAPEPGAVYWRQVLSAHIARIDLSAAPRGQATGLQAIAYLKALRDPRIPPDPAIDRLRWITSGGTSKRVSAGTVRNALAKARKKRTA